MTSASVDAAGIDPDLIRGVDTLFLDAGNTVIFLEHARLARLAGEIGFATTGTTDTGAGADMATASDDGGTSSGADAATMASMIDIGGGPYSIVYAGTSVGIDSRKIDVHFNWRPPELDDLSFDLGVTHAGAVPATLDNRVFLPERTMMDVDARYNMTLGGQPVSLRFSVLNVLGSRAWDLSDAGAYNIYWNSGRRLAIRLIADL